jgi:hypothetical protein
MPRSQENDEQHRHPRAAYIEELLPVEMAGSVAARGD